MLKIHLPFQIYCFWEFGYIRCYSLSIYKKRICIFYVFYNLILPSDLTVMQFSPP